MYLHWELASDHSPPGKTSDMSRNFNSGRVLILLVQLKDINAHTLDGERGAHDGFSSCAPAEAGREQRRLSARRR
jgi:hypothetical protein